MITLRKMTEEEFRAFKKYSVDDYAVDLMKGWSLSREQALKDAAAEFDRTLPDGLETEYSFLMNIKDANENRVGWIWFEYHKEESSGEKHVFLSNLLIFEPERRTGLSSAAIDEMNSLAGKDSCLNSELFVWDHNPEGMKLYEKCGYRPCRYEEGGILMAWEL